MKTRAELKQEVKDTFRGNWGSAIIMSLIPVLITGVAQYINQSTIASLTAALSVFQTYDEGFLLGMLLQATLLIMVVSLVVGFITDLLNVGVNFEFINWLKNKDLDFSPIKAPFKIFNGKDFIKIFLIMILETVWVTLWSLLFVIPGIIKAYSYSQAYYLYKKAKEEGTADQYSVMDYITQSRKLMNGHKWDLFVLQLSFIGWFLLSIITFGIGLLWLTPYMSATQMAFFNDLVANQDSKKAEA